MPKMYLVEDDKALQTEVVRLLELQGFSCIVCEDFPSAVEDMAAKQPDCVVLDLRLPGADGLALCRDMRAISAVPILVLTSSDSEFDEVMSMNLGADDFILKPYRPAVLIARIQALLRRAGNAVVHPVVAHRGVCLDLANGQVSFEGHKADLTRNEQMILRLLLAHPGVVISRSELMCELWESDAFVDDNTLTVNITRVRKALSSIGVPEGFILTKRGLGYMVAP